MSFLLEDSTNVNDASNIWNNLLQSVAEGTERSIPQVTVLVLGGTIQGTLDFVDSLRTQSGDKLKNPTENAIPTKCSNIPTFTYIELKDTDTEDTLANIRLYLLPGCESAHVPALGDFIATQESSNLVLCLLLDWHEPWTWLRTVRFWVKAVTQLVQAQQSKSSDFDTKCQEQSKALEMKIRTFTEQPKTAIFGIAQTDPSLSLPLEIEEFDRPLGMSLMCVAQNAEYTQILEQEYGFREEQFDFIQQVLRTVLLRHGGALIYTSASATGSHELPRRYLFRECFDSLYGNVKEETYDKASTVIRDQAFVPTGWDSWGKIKVLREGYSPEEISKGWTLDLDTEGDAYEQTDKSGVVNLFEEVITKPRSLVAALNQLYYDEIVVEIDPMEILKEVEQRQWEVQEAQEQDEDVQAYNSSPPRSRDMLPTIGYKGPDTSVPSKIRSTKDSQATSLQGSISKSGTAKDEYVQAFFQNLLNRSNSDKPA